MAGLALHLTLVEEVCDERLRLDENALQILANFALNIIHEQKPLGNGGDVELAIACVDQATSQRLNATYRHKDKPTNVLSFGADFAQLDGAIMLGDLVICLPVVLAEATKYNKPPAAHFTHLLIHGLLHLLGYDHETCTDAAIMEGLEIDILARLGLANPYAGDYEAD